jgi:hypothetical protein
MTRANTKQLKHTPWFAKAGVACSVVPILRFVGPNIFVLKSGGYGCLFSLTGIDDPVTSGTATQLRSCLLLPPGGSTVTKTILRWARVFASVHRTTHR